MKKNPVFRPLAALLLVAGLSSFAYAQAADPIAKVNGVAIPQSRLDTMIKGFAAQGQPDTPEFRARLRDELITREVLLQEAAKKGIDKNPDIVVQLELQRQGFLINAFLQDYARSNPITEDAVRKEYENAKAQAPAKEWKAHHILVKDETEAKQIIAQIKKGGNFEKIAAEKSVDPGARNNGGDLGWGNGYVPQFVEALAKLKKGQLTESPVQTQYGWHVIRLDDERPSKIPSFEEAKNGIMQQMQKRQIDKAVADFRAKAKVE
jgi:peptidyl-prolyl cis-trans isomerase C